MYPNHGSDDERLDALFRAYQAACPDREPGVNFMPGVWQKIEARQTFTFSFRRMANAFVTAAVALSIALGVYMAIPHSSPTYHVSYLEALAEANPVETPDIVGPIHMDPTAPGR